MPINSEELEKLRGILNQLKDDNNQGIIAFEKFIIKAANELESNNIPDEPPMAPPMAPPITDNFSANVKRKSTSLADEIAAKKLNRVQHNSDDSSSSSAAKKSPNEMGGKSFMPNFDPSKVQLKKSAGSTGSKTDGKKVEEESELQKAFRLKSEAKKTPPKQ